MLFNRPKTHATTCRMPIKSVERRKPRCWTLQSSICCKRAWPLLLSIFGPADCNELFTADVPAFSKLLIKLCTGRLFTKLIQSGVNVPAGSWGRLTELPAVTSPPPTEYAKDILGNKIAIMAIVRTNARFIILFYHTRIHPLHVKTNMVSGLDHRRRAAGRSISSCSYRTLVWQK